MEILYRDVLWLFFVMTTHFVQPVPNVAMEYAHPSVVPIGIVTLIKFVWRGLVKAPANLMGTVPLSKSARITFARNNQNAKRTPTVLPTKFVEITDTVSWNVNMFVRILYCVEGTLNVRLAIINQFASVKKASSEIPMMIGLDVNQSSVKVILTVLLTRFALSSSAKSLAE